MQISLNNLFIIPAQSPNNSKRWQFEFCHLRMRFNNAGNLLFERRKWKIAYLLLNVIYCKQKPSESGNYPKR